MPASLVLVGYTTQPREDSESYITGLDDTIVTTGKRAELRLQASRTPYLAELEHVVMYNIGADYAVSRAVFHKAKYDDPLIGPQIVEQLKKWYPLHLQTINFCGFETELFTVLLRLECAELNVHAADIYEIDMATTTDIEEVLLPPLYPKQNVNPWNLPLEVAVKRLNLLLPDEAPFAYGLEPYTDVSVTAQVLQRFGEYNVYRNNFRQIHEYAHIEAGGHFPEEEEKPETGIAPAVVDADWLPKNTNLRKDKPIKKKKKLKPKAVSK